MENLTLTYENGDVETDQEYCRRIAELWFGPNYEETMLLPHYPVVVYPSRGTLTFTWND
jgi:hypothetical protein